DHRSSIFNRPQPQRQTLSPPHSSDTHFTSIDFCPTTPSLRTNSITVNNLFQTDKRFNQLKERFKNNKIASFKNFFLDFKKCSRNTSFGKSISDTAKQLMNLRYRLLADP